MFVVRLPVAYGALTPLVIMSVFHAAVIHVYMRINSVSIQSVYAIFSVKPYY